MSLAVKYRPNTFESVCGQKETITILENQIKNGEVKNAYLFIGPAGCGKTTMARILANKINNNQGTGTFSGAFSPFIRNPPSRRTCR